MPLEWLTVSDPDLVLNHAGTTELIAIQCKNIMETQHQLSYCCNVLGNPVAEPIQIQLFQQLPLLLSH